MFSFQFSGTPSLEFGPGSIRRLPDVIKRSGKQVLLLTGGGSIQKSGMLEVFFKDFKAAGVSFFHEGVEGEPDTDCVDTLCRKYRGKDLSVLVSIGGGSVIDCGKAVSAMLTVPGSVERYLEGSQNVLSHPGSKLPFIACPTTAGTGAEMTKNAVITSRGQEGTKRSLRHENFIPDSVILDPELSLSCPPEITAACGMDAFTQLLESYVSTQATPLTDALALSGLKKFLFTFLPCCGNAGQDIQVRGDLMYGAAVSGITLANAGLGIVHGLAGPLGGLFRIPHGVVCGTLVWAATSQNLKSMKAREPHNPAIGKYKAIGMMAGCSDSRTGDEDSLLVEMLEYWTGKLRMPKLRVFGVREEDLPEIVEKSSNRNNPILLTRDEMHAILRSRL